MLVGMHGLLDATQVEIPTWNHAALGMLLFCFRHKQAALALSNLQLVIF